jgi:hypothetical protein
MKALALGAVLAALGLITFPGSASVLALGAPRSTTAWVLWWAEGSGMPGSHLDWETQSAYPDAATCKQNLTTALSDDTNGTLLGGKFSYRCLPDTIDPRGPKAEPRSSRGTST